MPISLATLGNAGRSSESYDVGRATPKARVFIYMKDKLAGDGSGKRVFVELVGFKSVNTNLSMSGMGTATIAIPDMKSALIRFISKETLDDIAVGKGKERHNDICKHYFDFIVNDPSKLFSTMWDDTVITRGDKSANLGAYVVDMKTWSRSRAELLKKGDIQKQLNVDNGLIYALPFIDVFDPIFVDYLGQDGFWYAGFSGLITRIGDSYYRTGQQSLSIQCKDYTCLLDNVSIVTAWTRFTKADQFNSVTDFAMSSEANVKASVSPFDNIFAEFPTVNEIIRQVVERAQDMWTLPNIANNNFGVHFGLDSSGNKIKIFNTMEVKKHEGMSARRCNSTASYGTSLDDFRGYHDLTPDDYLSPKLILLDTALYNMDNEFIHQMLNTNLSLFKDSLQSGDQILNQLVAQMFAYKHQDANGNLIFELAKYNALPNFMDYGGRGSATVLRHKAEEAVKVIENNSTTTFINSKGEKTTVVDQSASSFKTKKLTMPYCAVRGTVSFGIDPTGTKFDNDTNKFFPMDASETGFSGETISWYALKFHGLNYIMSPTDFAGFDTARDESTLITVATSNSVPPWLTPEANVMNSSEWYTGASSAPVELLAKLGIRRFNIANLYNVDWGGVKIGSLILSYISSFILERQNAQWDSGVIQLMHRPEMQLNRTFVIPLRWKSYLITGISNSWSMGGKHSTTLTVSYGHPIHQTLEFPWTAIEAEKKVFIDVQKTIKDIMASVDAEGKVNEPMDILNTWVTPKA